MKSMIAPRNVKLQYTKHIAILVSYLTHIDQYLILFFLIFTSCSVISSDMGVILPICMRNLKSGCAMLQILTGSQLWRRIVISRWRRIVTSEASASQLSNSDGLEIQDQGCTAGNSDDGQ